MSSFLVELDGMIESTEEFIRDDAIEVGSDPEGRLRDLDALNHVRKLYMEVFQTESTAFAGVSVKVGRRYYFEGTHHVPSLPAPWNEVHGHRYWVDVEARGSGDVVVDTDKMDRAWVAQEVPSKEADLDGLYGPENTTVEALAQRWLDELHGEIPAVFRVTVYEDLMRWGVAELG